ncbi:hypothetical protein GGR51DRAFT_560002 [Nemania sp. FL0031]|nr:hypothetical protein GGR51DRAFT_560002 [Nemania sp. FL0031]
MPAHRHRIGGLQDDIWKRNEETFRRLYLREHKTLKDVKKLMESEHSFPTTPLSTYESKLRDLGLRKKMKKKDWYPIYQHYVNSGYTHSALFFNGTRIPWEKAWKEIRRSGAREQNDGQASRLPADVVMRSPSPTLLVPTFDLPYRLPIPWELGDVSLMALSPAEVVHRSKLYDIPSNILRIDILNLFQQQALKRGYSESDKPSFDHHSLLGPTTPDIEPILFQSSSLSHQSSNHLKTDPDIDALAGALYQIANQDHNITRRFGEPLKAIIDRTPTYVLLKLLEGDSPIIQAAIEPIMKSLYTRDKKQNSLLSLLKVVYQIHPSWIDHSKFLEIAVRIGSAESCRFLLQRWRRPKPNTFRMLFDRLMRKGHVEFAKVIVEHLFKSDTAGLQPACRTAYKIFWRFLETLTWGQGPYYFQSPGVLDMLDWFLEAGAEVDLIPSSLAEYFFCAKYWRPIVMDWIYFRNLDLYSYLIGHSIKAKKEVTRSGAHRSASEGTDSLRSYLVLRAPHTPAQQDALLEFLLIEELRGAEYRHNVDFNAIKTLLDYNLDLHKLHWKLNPSKMLYCVIKAASQQGIHPALGHIVENLIYMGAAILPETLYAAAKGEGTTLLQLLSPLSVDLKDQGALALCIAMRLHNYDAIDWLLAMGADINATLPGDGKERHATSFTIFALANIDSLKEMCLSFEWHTLFEPGVYFDITCGDDEGSIISYEMLKYLISRNVKLRANPADPDLRRLLCLVIYNGLRNHGDIWEDTLNKVKILLDAEPLTNGQQETEPCLLEACLVNRFADDGGAKLPGRLIVMDYLLERGISARYSGVVALLIHHGAPKNEIEKVLNSCVDIDINTRSGRNIDYMKNPLRLTPLKEAVRVSAESLDLVRLLLQRGAHVNSPPNQGPTALQIACDCDRIYPYKGIPVSIDLIKLLIENGADANAPPPSDGVVMMKFTALQAACFGAPLREPDSIDLVRLLIDNGADVNAPASDVGHTALEAVCVGESPNQIALLTFLIDNGAEVNGYEALQSAATRGNFEVVLLLLKHGADVNAYHPRYGSVLDETVRASRLDMVKFLLDLGALSHDRGESGYRGAIRKGGGLAIADMIRKHALKNGKTGEELFSHNSEWKDASRGDGSDSGSDYGEIDAWYENENFGDERLLLY